MVAIDSIELKASDFNEPSWSGLSSNYFFLKKPFFDFI